MEHLLGAHKDIRKPDKEVQFYVPKAALRPRVGDWSQFNCYPFDQDHTNMCVGGSFNELIANDAARRGIIPAGRPLFYSPWYVYNWARFMRGWLAEDKGSFPEDAATAICEHGVLRYDRMPCKRDELGNIIFDPTDPATLEPFASRYPNLTKSRVDKGVEGLLAALADGVVSIAVPWFPGWGTSYVSGILPPIANLDYDGRHCILFDGWDEDRGLFFGPNTWGEWGIRESALGLRPFNCGFAMPFEYIELFKSKFDGYDAWDIDFDAAPPEPEMMFKLMVYTEKQGFGSGLYAPGSKVPIYAGIKSGSDFSRWKPGLNLDNIWSSKTIATVMDDMEIRAYWSENKKSPRRCSLFSKAKELNKQEGL